ncbi:methylated-DNA--[protein]-cysteine S-methyltransferase [Luedemannella helvata]|uniref:Methylated-DNA--protein-cysteine methyltransferase n=1 Tax=Luedemannella helvata TaxID=349315 RepID=A0ABN2KZS5_9ACTN
MRWVSLPSPIGDIGVAADDEGICAVRFDGPPADATLVPVKGTLAAAGNELAEYFAGERTEFTVPLSVRRGSEFERAVWSRIAAIGYGDTVTYGTIAAAVGQPDGAQAVGIACNRNPLPLVVPCHRVVGAGGKLVGFGGGLDRKRRLLDLEARVRLNQGLFW